MASPASFFIDLTADDSPPFELSAEQRRNIDRLRLRSAPTIDDSPEAVAPTAIRATCADDPSCEDLASSQPRVLVPAPANAGTGTVRQAEKRHKDPRRRLALDAQDATSLSDRSADDAADDKSTSTHVHVTGPIYLGDLLKEKHWHTTIINGVETRVRRPPLKPVSSNKQRLYEDRTSAVPHAASANSNKRPRTKMILVKRKISRPSTPSRRDSECSSTARVERMTRGPLSSTTPAVREREFVPAKWPHHVARISAQFNPENVQFEFESPFAGKCGCADPCFFHSCRNGVLSVFCTMNVCSFKGHCNNTLAERKSMRLVMIAGSSHFAVIAAAAIPKGVVVGEYLGRLVTRKKSLRQVVKNTGYRLRLARVSATHPRCDIFIDAEAYGGMTRFLNHSCVPTVRFQEVRNGYDHTVVAVTVKDIPAGAELTANYGDDLWFVCRCGEDCCIHRELQHLEDP